MTVGTEKFAALYDLLTRSGVAVAMAGDTHDFEYYRQPVGQDTGAGVVHHFVNGGGGASLSIGTALDFARSPAVQDSAFYPSGTALRARSQGRHQRSPTNEVA